MSYEELIDYANEINNYISETQGIEEHVKKELKKYEMYCRKTFIMLRGFDEYQTEHGSGEQMIKSINARLTRDQQFIKQRDRMESYEI